MAWPVPPRLLDACVEHLCQFLFLERFGYLSAEALDKDGPIALEIGADDVTRARYGNSDAIQEAAGARRQRSLRPTSCSRKPKATLSSVDGQG
jgi:hypothetical protein